MATLKMNNKEVIKVTESAADILYGFNHSDVYPNSWKKLHLIYFHSDGTEKTSIVWVNLNSVSFIE